ncbi:glycoside hydrolase [Saccharobesus litoralis]|uniref:Glycoside hydrolase n=1 Tax=Saccharobesus litoralis TaxID=2172099 RepID=A0A2S0VPS6_9ALTE|nr:glycosyl hydrolase [Saccharobesus litoralis]AWB66218.1 glycoside hydrolase [Saccharobesus litoralis]
MPIRFVTWRQVARRLSLTIAISLLLTSCLKTDDAKTQNTTAKNSNASTRLKTPTSYENIALHKPKSPMPESFYHAPAAELKANFKTPPDAVKPWVYWYWINDHISKQGIENDLAAMQKQGINTALIGIIHLNASIGGYGQVSALSEEWWDHLRFAIEKAAEYKIDIGLFNSPGWSQSGGPWVSLDQSMRYLDSKEYQVDSQSIKSLKLSKPKGYAQDVKLLAFQTPKQEQQRLSFQQTKVKVKYPQHSTFAHPSNNPQQLIDGDHQSVYLFPTEVIDTKNSRVRFDFKHNELLSARTLEIYPHDTFSAKATLSAKQANGEYKVIKTFVVQRPRKMAAIGPDHDAPIVVNFTKTPASEFRLTLNNIKLGRGGKNSVPGIKELVLSSGYKLERYVEKKLAKVHPTPQPKHDSYQWPTPLAADEPSLAISAEKVLDISEFMKGERVNWSVPKGEEWTMVHYFMRSTGTTNGPSSKNAKGPEIDKLSKEIAQYHFDAYIGKILQSMPAQKRTAFKYAVVDSYEQGAQNWTDGFAQKFEQHYGYDPIPFLPVYTGRIVNSAEQSERFLWDVRRMVADRVSYEYTAGLRERAHQHGLKLWLENYGHWGFPGEFLQYGGQADIVSGEFWASGNLGAIELKAASSAAHIYGHKTVMSESFTAGRSDSFINHPWNFKKRGDWSFVEGINHTLLHVYIQQAYEDKLPGVNAWFGSEFNRHNTWFDYMGSWLDYVKRCNYLMQQGHYVADIMYFIGEDAPKMTGALQPALPAGYAYDFINAEVILKGLSVENGEFVLPSGMRFKLLVLPDSSTMRPAVLEKIQSLVAAGGTVYGPKPKQSPSLQGYPQVDQQIQAMANTLWQAIDGENVTQANYGLGQVFYQTPEQADLAQVMQTILRQPDLADLPADVIWSHRSSNTHDIFFIANQTDSPVNIKPSFRLSAKWARPQYWDAVTGQMQTLAQYQIDKGRLTIPLSLQGLGSAFIVFEKSHAKSLLASDSVQSIQAIDPQQAKYRPLVTSAFDSSGQLVLDIQTNGKYLVHTNTRPAQTLTIDDLPPSQVFTTPWQLTLTEGRDVATQLQLSQLVSLTELEPLALKHYSGSIIYRNQLAMTDNLLRDDQRWILDLGQVGVIAKVNVNGVDLDDVWSRPLQVDITDALQVGNNQIEINVATTWVNRLVGDQKYPEQFPDSAQAKAFNSEITFASKVTKDTPLQPTGLIGPVKLTPLRKVKL